MLSLLCGHRLSSTCGHLFDELKKRAYLNWFLHKPIEAKSQCPRAASYPSDSHDGYRLKLRITSLSSHRDKQKFRIQVAPQDVEMQLSEPNLQVVTDPMKSVTKLGRTSNAGASANGGLPMPPPMPAEAQAAVDGLKRKYREALEEQSMQLQSLAQTQGEILRELQQLVRLAQQQPGALLPETKVDPKS